MTTRLTKNGKLLVISTIWLLIGVILMLPEWILMVIQTWMTMTYSVKISMVFFTPALIVMAISMFAGIIYTFTYEDTERTGTI